ncbi:MAG TPA: ATP-dependent zinc protease [Mariprofundaceae bacterium]|nr:ATP-dependent zinc protease [Mariprofundaceae bacterium]
MSLVMLGWREWVSLPELGIESIKAKVDTGARTSALHTYFLDTFTEDGVAKVRFSIHPYQHDLSVVRECVANLADERKVTDSGGHAELRPVISTPICLGGITKHIEMTLTNRENMKFRMLLGRTAMYGDFSVDPAGSYLLGKPNNEQNVKGSIL